MYKYAIVVMNGNTGPTQTTLNALASQGYRVIQVIPTAATAPCTYHDAAFLLEKFEPAAPVALPLPSEGRTGEYDS